MQFETRTTPQLSLLDRFSDDPPVRLSAAHLRQSVRRDLECLLNTRRSWLPAPATLRELKKSVLGYGLPDFTAVELDTAEGRQWLCQEVERTIVRFEPRLSRVRVSSNDTDTWTEPFLRLRIEAVLLAGPASQPVTFDSELEPVDLSLSLLDASL